MPESLVVVPWRSRPVLVGFPTAPSGSLDGGWLEPIVSGLYSRSARTGNQAVGGVEFLGKGRIEIDYAQMRLRNFVGGVESHLTNL